MRTLEERQDAKDRRKLRAGLLQELRELHRGKSAGYPKSLKRRLVVKIG